MDTIQFETFTLWGDFIPQTAPKGGYFIHVVPEKAPAGVEYLFSEFTEISHIALLQKYGPEYSKAAEEIKKITLAKTKARIALGLYELGEEYKQLITVETLTSPPKPVTDAYIQKTLLTGLMNVRRNYPQDFQHRQFDIAGLCAILSIEKNNYLFNAGLLKDDGYIALPNISQIMLANGGGYITSSGVSKISELTTRIIDTAVESKIESSAPQGTQLTRGVFEFDVAISFAGEERDIAQKINAGLRARNISVFFADEEQENLWGKNLLDYFSYVYNKAAKLCIMIISENYANKSWTTFERQNAQARAFRENVEYILPLRIDDTTIPGLPETIGYIKYSEANLDKIIGMIHQKLQSIP